MHSLILSFLLGDLWLQTFASLPTYYFAFTLMAISFIPFFIFKKNLLPLAFTLGFTFTLFNAHSILAWTLKKEWEGKPLIATGTIASLPRPHRFGTQFEFHLESLSNFMSVEHPNTMIRLSLTEHSSLANELHV